jgi:hypothetical protein
MAAAGSAATITSSTTPEGVLAFDPGLRHLAVALVTRSAAPVPEALQTRARPEETAAQYRDRALQWYLAHGWALVKWEVLDVTDALDREGGVANVKAIHDVTKALALSDTLQALVARWFGIGGRESGDGGGSHLPPPSRVVVEAQHNANALMRGVAMSILVFFRHTLPSTQLAMVSGSRKLDLCAALGIARGDGLAAKGAAADAKAAAAAAKAAVKAAKAAARAAKAAKSGKGAKRDSSDAGGPGSLLHQMHLVTTAGGKLVVQAAAAAAVDTEHADPADPAHVADDADDEHSAKNHWGRRAFGGRGRGRGRGGLMRMSASARDGYDDNKRRAVMAVERLLPGGHAALDDCRGRSVKTDDLCDVLLMAVWVLWQSTTWRLPPRGKGPAAAPTRRPRKPTVATASP